MDGLKDKEVRVNLADGWIVIPAEKTQRQEKRNVSRADEKKEKKEVNILRVDPPHLHVQQEAKERSGVKKVVNYF